MLIFEPVAVLGLLNEAQALGLAMMCVAVPLDLGIDLSTPAGEFLANVMASAAQWERKIIGQRTRDALAVRKAQGVVLGRPVELPQDIGARIVRERADGFTLQTIANGLHQDAVPTAQGGARWHASTVRAVIRRLEASPE
jgi:DNA invertase Pin-like site-specific DNA recombinase